jgi:hypothetical protein
MYVSKSMSALELIVLPSSESDVTNGRFAASSSRLLNFASLMMLLSQGFAAKLNDAIELL